MDISASDVESVTFATAKKGYDADQVDRFLDGVAASIRNLEEQLRQARSRAEELQTEASSSRETEAMMRRTLEVAQRASDEAVAEAQARAREIVTTAEAQAREMETTSRARADELEGRMLRQRQAFDADIEALKRFHQDFRQSLQQMISEHADLLHKTGRLAEQVPDVPSETGQPAVAPPPPPATAHAQAQAQRPASLAPEPRGGAAVPRHAAPETPPPPAPRPASAPDVAPAEPSAPPPPQVAPAATAPAPPPRPATAPDVGDA